MGFGIFITNHLQKIAGLADSQRDQRDFEGRALDNWRLGEGSRGWPQV